MKYLESVTTSYFGVRYPNHAFADRFQFKNGEPIESVMDALAVIREISQGGKDEAQRKYWVDIASKCTVIQKEVTTHVVDVSDLLPNQRHEKAIALYGFSECINAYVNRDNEEVVDKHSHIGKTMIDAGKYCIDKINAQLPIGLVVDETKETVTHE